MALFTPLRFRSAFAVFDRICFLFFLLELKTIRVCYENGILKTAPVLQGNFYFLFQSTVFVKPSETVVRIMFKGSAIFLNDEFTSINQ